MFPNGQNSSCRNRFIDERGDKWRQCLNALVRLRCQHVSFRSDCYPRRDNSLSWNDASADVLVEIYEETITSLLDKLSSIRSKSFRVRSSNVWFNDELMTVMLQKDWQDFESGIITRANYLKTECYGLHNYLNTTVFAKRRETYSGGFK